jgi:hypothetical protein
VSGSSVTDAAPHSGLDAGTMAAGRADTGREASPGAPGAAISQRGAAEGPCRAHCVGREGTPLLDHGEAIGASMPMGGGRCRAVSGATGAATGPVGTVRAGGARVPIARIPTRPALRTLAPYPSIRVLASARPPAAHLMRHPFHPSSRSTRPAATQSATQACWSTVPPPYIWSTEWRDQLDTAHVGTGSHLRRKM